MIAIHSVLLLALTKITRAVVETETRTCGPMPRRPAPLHTNRRLKHNEIAVLEDFNLERCVLECFLVSRCASLNYVYVGDAEGRWELNGATIASVGKREYSTRYVYYDLEQWANFPALAGSCASRPCDENQRCIPTSPYTCADVDCGPPPYFTKSAPPWLFHVTPTRGMTSLGSHRGYTCNNRWAFNAYTKQANGFRDVGYIICSSNSRWTTIWRDCYSLITTCKEVQACNPGSPDGHYHVYTPYGVFSKAVMVNCRNMTTSTPYMEDALPDATPDDVIEHACATNQDI